MSGQGPRPIIPKRRGTWPTDPDPLRPNGNRPEPQLSTDDDRNHVGTIYGPDDRPLHTVKRPEAVDFGYQRPDDHPR